MSEVMDIADRLDQALAAAVWAEAPKETLDLYQDSINEIETLRDALDCLVTCWDKWKDARDGSLVALSLEEVVGIARKALNGTLVRRQLNIEERWDD